MENNKLKIISNLFEGYEIRSIWNADKEEYYFNITDVIKALTDSPNPSQYWRILKFRMIKEGNETVTNCNTFKFKAKDGKMRNADVLDTQGILRLIESIPSSKAEPFKMWLDQMGKENKKLNQDLKQYYISVEKYLCKSISYFFMKNLQKTLTLCQK